MQFQFTRPQGARLRLIGGGDPGNVSIHAPARGATTPKSGIGREHLFQFTRPQGARLDGTARASLPIGVSIHAPARGATLDYTPDFTANEFQFTRPQGARQERILVIQCPPNSFNSRARKGRDMSSSRGLPLVTRFNSRARKGRDIKTSESRTDSAVSIHAPARGATSTRRSSKERQTFQFTRPQGARLTGKTFVNIDRMFQFTRPQGARLVHYLHLDNLASVSIHAPARGATDAHPGLLLRLVRFNSRARKGRDAIRMRILITLFCFNSRARKGRDTSYL